MLRGHHCSFVCVLCFWTNVLLSRWGMGRRSCYFSFLSFFLSFFLFESQKKKLLLPRGGAQSCLSPNGPTGLSTFVDIGRLSGTNCVDISWHCFRESIFILIPFNQQYLIKWIKRNTHTHSLVPGATQASLFLSICVCSVVHLKLFQNKNFFKLVNKQTKQNTTSFPGAWQHKWQEESWRRTLSSSTKCTEVMWLQASLS